MCRSSSSKCTVHTVRDLLLLSILYGPIFVQPDSSLFRSVPERGERSESALVTYCILSNASAPTRGRFPWRSRPSTKPSYSQLVAPLPDGLLSSRPTSNKRHPKPSANISGQMLPDALVQTHRSGFIGQFVADVPWFQKASYPGRVLTFLTSRLFHGQPVYFWLFWTRSRSSVYK